MSKNWTKMLSQYEDAVKHDEDPYAPENCLYSPSPYFNWLFANKSMGIPRGAGVLFFSEAKSGKSMMIQAIIEEMHKRDPEGIAIVFNTEMRGRFQKGLFKGIDPKRLIIYDTADPAKIFDRLIDEIAPMVEDGMPLRLVAFDSITMIAGVKAEGRSVKDHLVGDRALTVSRGWQRVIPFLKEKNITYIGTEQMRANIDAQSKYEPSTKMAASFITKHSFEYFVSIKRSGSKEDREDMHGEGFENAEIKDARGNANKTGHQIYFKLEQSSLGGEGRSGKLTLDYKKGIINRHEEVFLLGYNTGVIKREGTSKYIFGETSIIGKANFADAIKESPELSAAIIEAVRKLEE